MIAQKRKIDVFKPFVCGDFCVFGGRFGLGRYHALVNLT